MYELEVRHLNYLELRELSLVEYSKEYCRVMIPKVVGAVACLAAALYVLPNEEKSFLVSVEEMGIHVLLYLAALGINPEHYVIY